MTPHPARPVKAWSDPDTLAEQIGAAWEAIPDDVEADTLADAIAHLVRTKDAAMAVIRDIWAAIPNDIEEDRVMTAEQVKLLVEQRDEARAQAAANTTATGDAAYWKRVAEIALGSLDYVVARGRR